ncbi:MAG: SDR family NAD(P)-dependent oxidoreductase [Anaerolineales bacterium]|nr:MAG: SDR family NAD(P)-dependent oxidoreductase [Anaerolineales bacterium]
MGNKDLLEKVVLLTGASAGIGAATARQLAAAGAHLALAARRQTRLRRLAVEIAGQGGQILVVKTDLSDYTQIRRLVRRTLAVFGRIDVLVNIAGWGSYSWMDTAKAKHLETQFAVNVLAPLHLTRLLLPDMQRRRSGHIINMVSYASRVAVPPQTIYAGTKYALEGLTDGLRRELRPWGIHVSRVHPGGVSGTEFNDLAARRGGVGFQSPGVGNLSRESVARAIHRLILHPRRELMLGRLYDVPAFINRYAPWLVDWAMAWWVRRKRKMF